MEHNVRDGISITLNTITWSAAPKIKQAAVRVTGENRTDSKCKGVTQGCIHSLYLFNIYTYNTAINVKIEENYGMFDSLNIVGNTVS